MTTKVNYNQIKDAEVSVRDFGLVTAGDLSVPLLAAITYAVANGLNVIYVPAGAYGWTTPFVYDLAPASGATATLFGLTIKAEGVNITLPAGQTGYALGFKQSGSTAYIHYPLLEVYGMRWFGNATSSGAISLLNCSFQIWHATKAENFTYMPGGGPDGLQGCLFHRICDGTLYAENNIFESCASVNCQAMETTLGTSGAFLSFARTNFLNPFIANDGAEAVGFWWGNDSTIYDSLYSNIRGNNGGRAIFSIGDCYQLGTTIVGLKMEANSIGVNNKGVILLRTHPSATAFRPSVYDVANSVTDNGNIPFWIDATNTETYPETGQIQTFYQEGPMTLGGPVEIRDTLGLTTNAITGGWSGTVVAAGNTNFSITGQVGEFLVSGSNSVTNLFIDRVYFWRSTAAGATNVFTTGTNPARTYTVSGQTLNIALAAGAGTWAINISPTMWTGA